MTTSIKDRIYNCIRDYQAPTIPAIQRYVRKATGSPIKQAAVLFHITNLLAENKITLSSLED